MPRKKKEEEIEETVADETAVEAQDAAETEDKPKRSRKKAAAETDGETEAESSIIEDVAGAVAGVVEAVAETAASVIETVTETLGGGETKKVSRGNRAEKIGVIWSDKMEKTVVVRVDRVVKHPMYRKYVKRKKKFMAHDELGATIGDKVRIVETRPLSARKRWRVVEIIQKAEK